MKIGILGFGPTRALAPLDDKSWRWWGMAHDHEWPKFERIFEMHERTEWERLHGPRLAT